MQNLTSQEQSYLQVPECGGQTGLTRDGLDDFTTTMRSKLLKAFGEQLTASGITHDITSGELTSCMGYMADSLQDMLGNLPLYAVVNRNERRA